MLLCITRVSYAHKTTSVYIISYSDMYKIIMHHTTWVFSTDRNYVLSVIVWPH